MDGLDIAILVVVGLSTLWGLARGFTRTVLLLALWVLAVVLALEAGRWLAAFVTPRPIANPFLARLVIFVAVVLAVRVLGGLLLHGLWRDLDAHRRLRAFDRGLGALFGFVRGVLLVIVLLLAARAVGVHPGRDAPRSRLLPLLRPWVARARRLGGIRV